MSPGPGRGADEILSSAGRSQASKWDRAPSPAEGAAREEMQTKAQPRGRKVDPALGLGPECGVHTHPQGWWHLSTADFKSIFSSPEPKPHPHGLVRETEGISVWQRGSGQGRWSLSLTPSLPNTQGTNPPQISRWDFAYDGAIPLQRQALDQPQPFPASPHHPVPHPELHSKAPPGPVWEKVNWKSPFFPSPRFFLSHCKLVNNPFTLAELCSGHKAVWGAGFHASPSRSRREGINVLFCSRMNHGFSRALTLQTSKTA